VLSVGLEDGDLPLRIAFPVMIKNAMESFLGGKGELRPALAAGQTTSVPATGVRKPITDLGPTEGDEESKTSATGPAVNREPLVLRSPKGNLERLSSATEEIQVGPFESVGLWWIGPESTLNQESESAFWTEEAVPIAVNLANAEESDLRPRTELPGAPVVSAVWGGHSMWFYLTLGAAVGICLEWMLYQRRIVA
jgi:hypothetical protein